MPIGTFGMMLCTTIGILTLTAIGEANRLLEYAKPKILDADLEDVIPPRSTINALFILWGSNQILFPLP